MNPTTDKYAIGDIVYYRYHRRDGRGRIYKAYGPAYQATILKKGKFKDDDNGYVITYTNEYDNKETFFWAYDQELDVDQVSLFRDKDVELIKRLQRFIRRRGAREGEAVGSESSGN